MPRKYKLIILFFSLFACITYNEINRAEIKKQYPDAKEKNTQSLVHDGTIWSIDNVGYLPQAKNLLNGKGFVSDTANKYSSIRRSPGYPVFYLVHYSLLGEKVSHKIIPYTQSLLFAFSALLLALAFYHITGNNKFSFILGLLYGSNPFTTGFVYYTITEAVHPAFAIIGFYFFCRTLITGKIVDGAKTGFSISLATLVRPTNGLLLPVTIASLAIARGWPLLKKAKLVIIISLSFLFLVSAWAFRNYLVVKDPVFLEKFYHEDPMGMGRSQTYLSRWWMCWGNPRPEIFFYGLQEDIRAGNNNFLDSFMAALPAAAIRGYTTTELRATLEKFKSCLEWKIKNGVNGKVYGPADTIPSCENETSNSFIKLIRQYKQADPISYYLINPITKRGKLFILQSFSYQLGSLNPADGKLNLVQKGIKSAMYMINLLLFVCFFIFLFLKARREIKAFISLFVLGTLLFYIYNVHIEVRYGLATYPFLYFAMAYTLFKMKIKWMNPFFRSGVVAH